MLVHAVVISKMKDKHPPGVSHTLPDKHKVNVDYESLHPKKPVQCKTFDPMVTVSELF